MGEQRARMGSGQWYMDEPELVEERRRCWRLVDRFNAAPADADDERRRVLDELLGGIGPESVVMPTFRCSYGHPVRIGARVLVNYDAIFMDDAPITVGDDVLIGPRVQLLTARHPVADHARRRERWERCAPIAIGANAWLAGGVIVGPGVTIGENSVVGAGSVVLRDVPPHVLVAGNPASVVRDLPDEPSC